MDITALKYFMVVAQTQHMNRAALKLNITQPALSISIKRLEAELGYKFFDRTGRGIQLNEYGKIFLRGVEQADAAMNRSLTEMEDLRKANASIVRLACSSSATNSRLINCLLDRGFNLEVDNIPAHWEQELLMKNCDLVITICPSHNSAIDSEALCQQKLAFVVSQRHPLAGTKAVHRKELEQYPFCSICTEHSILNVIKESCPEEPFSPRIAFCGRSSDDMLAAIHSGRYIGLMVEKNIPPSHEFSILTAADMNLSLPIYLYWRKNGAMEPAFSSVRQGIVDFYHSLSDDL